MKKVNLEKKKLKHFFSRNRIEKASISEQKSRKMFQIWN